MKHSVHWWALPAFVLLAALYSASAKSETAIWAGAWSSHPLSDEEYTSSHDLVAVEHENWMAARFRNSHGRESYDVGYGRSWQHGDVRLAGYIGVVRGYTVCWNDDDSNTNVCPMAVGAAHYTKYRVQPGVLLMGQAVALSFRVELY